MAHNLACCGVYAIWRLLHVGGSPVSTPLLMPNVAGREIPDCCARILEPLIQIGQRNASHLVTPAAPNISMAAASITPLRFAGVVACQPSAQPLPASVNLLSKPRNLSRFAPVHPGLKIHFASKCQAILLRSTPNPRFERTGAMNPAPAPQAIR